MVYYIIGATFAGKSTFIKNSWVNEAKSLQEYKDLVPYTTADNAILMGKYVNQETRIVGADKISRSQISRIPKQIVKIYQQKQDVDFVVDGVKVTFGRLLEEIMQIGIPVTLIHITCTLSTTCKRNEDNGSNNHVFHKCILTKSKNMYNKYKDMVTISHEVYTDNFTNDDLENFSIKNIKEYAQRFPNPQPTLF